MIAKTISTWPDVTIYSQQQQKDLLLSAWRLFPPSLFVYLRGSQLVIQPAPVEATSVSLH
jgi:hypothetical protein